MEFKASEPILLALDPTKCVIAVDVGLGVGEIYAEPYTCPNCSETHDHMKVMSLMFYTPSGEETTILMPVTCPAAEAFLSGTVTEHLQDLLRKSLDNG